MPRVFTSTGTMELIPQSLTDKLEQGVTKFTHAQIVAEIKLLNEDLTYYMDKRLAETQGHWMAFQDSQIERLMNEIGFWDDKLAQMAGKQQLAAE